MIEKRLQLEPASHTNACFAGDMLVTRADLRTWNIQKPVRWADDACVLVFFPCSGSPFQHRLRPLYAYCPGSRIQQAATGYTKNGKGIGKPLPGDGGEVDS